MRKTNLYTLSIIGCLLMGGCKVPQTETYVPFGPAEAIHIKLSQEARELLNQFPLVQILDEHLDLTVNIVWFNVRDESGEEFVLFYRHWDGTWIKRTKRPDGSNAFEPYP